MSNTREGKRSGFSVLGIDILDIGKLKVSFKHCVPGFVIVADLLKIFGISLGDINLHTICDNNNLFAVLAFSEEESVYKDLFAGKLTKGLELP